VLYQRAGAKACYTILNSIFASACAASCLRVALSFFLPLSRGVNYLMSDCDLLDKFPTLSVIFSDACEGGYLVVLKNRRKKKQVNRKPLLLKSMFVHFINLIVICINNAVDNHCVLTMNMNLNIYNKCDVICEQSQKKVARFKTDIACQNKDQY